MGKVKSKRNRTLCIQEQEREIYAKQLIDIKEDKDYSLDCILDKTICGDLLLSLKKLPTSFADLIIIDPPYNLDKNFHGFKFKTSNLSCYKAYLDTWFSGVIKTLKPNGSVYLCGDWKCTSILQQVMQEHLCIMNRITWQREKGRGALNNWKNAMEDIWFGVKNPKDYYFDTNSIKVRRRVLAPYQEDGKPKDWEDTKEGKFRLTYPSNLWDDISIPYWSMKENTDHPTQKPEKLVAKLILASCPIDGVVFDPFLGSGTSSVVAKKLGRHYVGVEQNQEYCIWAEKRLSIASFDKRIQGYENGIFYERNTPIPTKPKFQREL